MTINERHKNIADRLLKHDAARKIIEGELLALRHECQHPNMEVTHSNTWGRFESTDYNCPDCGLRR